MSVSFFLRMHAVQSYYPALRAPLEATPPSPPRSEEPQHAGLSSRSFVESKRREIKFGRMRCVPTCLSAATM